MASLGTLLGVAFGVASAVSWALGTVYFKRYAGRLPVLWAVEGRSCSTPRSWGRR